LDESNSRATTEIGRVRNQAVGARIKEIVKKRKKRTAHVLVQRSDCCESSMDNFPAQMHHNGEP